MQKLFTLMRLRNTSDAFNGDFSVRQGEIPTELILRWEKGTAFAELAADFETLNYDVRVHA